MLSRLINIPKRIVTPMRNLSKASLDVSPRISIMRHAETEWNNEKCIQNQFSFDNICLTEKGKRETTQKLSFFKKPDLLILSPRRRCIQTAEAWFKQDLEQIPCQTVFLDGLKEINAGELEGIHEEEIVTIDRYRKLWYLWKNEPQHFPGFPGGENLLTMQTRVLTTFSKISKDHASSNLDICVITHGVPMRILKCFLEGKPLSQLWKIDIFNLCRFNLTKNELRQLQEYDNENAIVSQCSFRL